MASDALVLDMGERLERFKKQAKAVKERAERITSRTMVGVAGAAGAGLTGVLQAELGEECHFPGTEIEADLTVGGLIVVAAAFGLMGDKYADEAVAFGSGMMAPAIARKTRSLMKK